MGMILEILCLVLIKNKITPFMKMFWEEQQKYMSSSKEGVRYHPMIICYCLD